ncbi:hypothetical protein O0I10_001470 [Lichtheimia ornata]|uniref:Uncharacterized protein n=1 Tax=Lichtheimia ornata TaxID=688661 RepID=A0AAD7Y1A9_9FUNG|nr:uncharacterized protein O0I10_001470 [Lichtheimia ornata]KAJ8662510.1 hypothetical protein O0I10_001470 [Lichtheimia ornata]
MSTELYGLLSTATPNLCIDHEDGGKEQVHLNNQIATLAVALDMVKEQFHDQLEAIQDVVNKMENTLRQLSDHHQHQQPAVSMATPFSVPTHMPMSPPMVTTPGHEDTDDFFDQLEPIDIDAYSSPPHAQSTRHVSSSRAQPSSPITTMSNYDIMMTCLAALHGPNATPRSKDHADTLMLSMFGNRDGIVVLPTGTGKSDMLNNRLQLSYGDAIHEQPTRSQRRPNTTKTTRHR